MRLYVLLPSSVFLFFRFLLSCIFSIMAVVIHDFLATFLFKYPTFPSVLFITTPFKFSQLSSVVPCLKHCTSFSIFSKQFYLAYQTVQLPLFLLFPPWYFLQLNLQ